MTRQQYLEYRKKRGTATQAELDELHAIPVFVGGQDGGGVMVVPRRGTIDEFMKLQDIDGPTDERPTPVVVPDPIRQQAEEMAQDVCERVAPMAELINSIIEAHRPAEQQASGDAAPKAKSRDDFPELGPEYRITGKLPDGRFTALYSDPGLPRNPPREVIIDAKRMRKARLNGMRAMRRGPSGGRSISI